MLIYLQHDPNRSIRTARQAQIHDLICAEFDRVKDQADGMTRDELIAQWPAYVEGDDCYGWGGYETSFPYTPLAVALSRESMAINRRDDVIAAECSKCGGHHPKLWLIQRAGCVPFGHFPTARINGAVEVIDPTLPHTVERIPTGSIEVVPDRAAELWHNTAHYFG